MGFAALMMAACSSDEIAGVDGGEVKGQEGDAFVSLNIAIPNGGGGGAYGAQHKAMRGGIAGGYEFGDDSEYAVHNVSVLVFDKDGNLENVYSTEDNTLAAPNWNEGNGQVERKASLPGFKVRNAEMKKIFVTLNYKKLEQLKATTNMWGLNDILLEENASTYSTRDGEDGFLMCNSTLANPVAGTVSFVVDVTPSETKAKAELAENRKTVYVERVVGKVTVAVTAASAGNWKGWTYTVHPALLSGPNPSPAAGATIKLNTWMLDVTNNSSYLVRHFDPEWLTDDDWEYLDVNRFYESNPLETNVNRVNFAIDPNYATFGAENFTSAFKAKAPEFYENMGRPGYCYENTFNVQNQRQDRTTRALIKATYKPNVSKGGYKFTEGESWYTVGASEIPLTADELRAYLKASAAKVLSTETEPVSENDVYVAVENFSGTITNFTGLIAIKSVLITSEQSAKLIEKINNVKAYKNGVCYYVIRVKHFGDKETPWGGLDTAPEHESTKYYEYGTEESFLENLHYLGRYGVVRNNWYQINIRDISGPGTPEIPEPDGTKIDDEHSYYIAADINILSWRIRKQTEDL